MIGTTDEYAKVFRGLTMIASHVGALACQALVLIQFSLSQISDCLSQPYHMNIPKKK